MTTPAAPYNPYAQQKTPQASPGIIGSVANVAATPTASKVEDATATGYTGTGYNAQTGKASTYNAAQATGTNWDVDANQTVQGQVNNIIAADSPLMQQAATRAAQQSASKGLLNSSLAVQAGQSALYDAAMPMAQQDAQTYADRGRYNADVANNMSQFNTTAKNEASQFNAGAANDMTRANMDATNTASQFTAGAKNDANQFTAGAKNETSQFNANQQNEATQNDANRNLEASKANQATQLERATTQFKGALDAAMANADNATKVVLQQIDGKVRENVASIEGEFKLALQSSTAAQEMFNQAITNITNLVTNPDLNAASKNLAIDQQIKMLRQTMNLQAAITDIPGLSTLVNNLGDGTNPYWNNNTPGTNHGNLQGQTTGGNTGDPYKAPVAPTAPRPTTPTSPLLTANQPR